jgi:hypothetical protein
MKRGSVCLVLSAVALSVGLATLFICSANRARGAELDRLHRECQNLILRNEHSRARVIGHRPGDLERDAFPGAEVEQ